MRTKKMAKLNVFAGIGFILLAILVMSECSRLGIGSFHEPGAGLYPGLVVTLLIVVSVLLMIQSLALVIRERGMKEKRPATADLDGDLGTIGFERAKMKRVGFVILLLLLSSIFFEMAGFLLSTFLLVFFIVKVVERESWVLSIIVSFGSTVPAYIIFKVFLRVPLPAGVLGFF